ncbi:Hypothetical protein A131_54480 [Lactobacillus gasseri CECT 5714]|nr:Hypothetical protein A131_54480 [Lactobacillus gasseri CECT 5714]
MEQKLNDTQLRRGRLAMANDAQQAMEKYVPKNHGYLRDHAKVATDGSSVYYVAPYARAQFYGFITNQYGGPFRIHNYTKPGTSRRWDLRLKGNLSEMAILKNEFLKGAMWHE